jgi:hypothetical protein
MTGALPITDVQIADVCLISGRTNDRRHCRRHSHHRRGDRHHRRQILRHHRHRHCGVDHLGHRQPSCQCWCEWDQADRRRHRGCDVARLGVQIDWS